MELSTPRFKSLAVTAGLSLWFVVITSSIGLFSYEITGLFVFSVLIITQILSSKISKALDIFAIFNTKIFLGVLFVFVISIYGILFKLLKIDLLRLQKQNDTYWLKIEQLKEPRIFKQY